MRFSELNPTYSEKLEERVEKLERALREIMQLAWAIDKDPNPALVRMIAYICEQALKPEGK